MNEFAFLTKGVELEIYDGLAQGIIRSKVDLVWQLDPDNRWWGVKSMPIFIKDQTLSFVYDGDDDGVHVMKFDLSNPEVVVEASSDKAHLDMSLIPTKIEVDSKHTRVFFALS